MLGFTLRTCRPFFKLALKQIIPLIYILMINFKKKSRPLICTYISHPKIIRNHLMSLRIHKMSFLDKLLIFSITGKVWLTVPPPSFAVLTVWGPYSSLCRPSQVLQKWSGMEKCLHDEMYCSSFFYIFRGA